MTRAILAVIAAAIAACAPPQYHTSTAPQYVESPPAEVSVVDFGASPELADNGPAFRAAVAAAGAGKVHVPAGRWTLGRDGNAYRCLGLPAGVTLIGEPGAVLVQAANIALSVNLFEVLGAGVTLQDLELDGQRAQQSESEHRHGVFARAAGLTIRGVVAHGFTGDGFYLFTGADGATLDAVTAEGNGRNGLTFGGAITGGLVDRSMFCGNRAQQVDSEPGSPAHVDGIRITRSTIDGIGSNDYALTVCGSAGARSSTWVVEGNTINGAIYVVWASDIVVRENAVLNPTSKPGVFVYRANERITVERNDIVSTAASGVVVQSTGTGQAGREVAIRGNRVTSGGPAGVFVSGAVSVAIEANVITSPRGPAGGNVAVAARATNPEAPLELVVVRGNTATGWERGLAIAGMTGTAAAITRLDAVDNTLGAPWWLDEGSGALRGAVISGDPAPEVKRWPAGAAITTRTVTTMTR